MSVSGDERYANLCKSIEDLTEVLDKKKAKLDSLRSSNDEEGGYLEVIASSIRRLEDDLENKRRQTKEFESTMNRTKQTVDSISSTCNWLSDKQVILEKKKESAQVEQKCELDRISEQQVAIIQKLRAFESHFVLELDINDYDVGKVQKECDEMMSELSELNPVPMAELDDGDVGDREEEIQRMTESVQAEISATTEEVVMLTDVIETLKVDLERN